MGVNNQREEEEGHQALGDGKRVGGHIQKSKGAKIYGAQGILTVPW